MFLRRLQAPAAELVSLATALAHVKVEIEDEPTDGTSLAAIYLTSAIDQVDGPSGILGRALVSQRWAQDLERFPVGPIPLELPPLISVEAVRYIDLAGVTQTLAPERYIVHPGELALVEPAPGSDWPATRKQLAAVTVEFTAGYGPTAADVPSRISAAVLLMFGDLFKNRETSVEGSISSQISMSTTVRALLLPFHTKFL